MIVIIMHKIFNKIIVGEWILVKGFVVFIVCFSPPGFNIPKRRRRVAKIGAKHKVQKDEAMKWFQQKVSP